MTEVRSARAAMNLDALHAETLVARRSERAGKRIEEAGPACSAVELLSGPEQRLVASGAEEISGPFLMIEGATPRTLCPVTAHDAVLLRR